MIKTKQYQLKKKKNNHKKGVVLFEKNGKVYDIYTGKVFDENDVFDKETLKLKKIVRDKYG
jgi:hypothetical protein